MGHPAERSLRHRSGNYAFTSVDRRLCQSRP
jgi:hypothetical protein